MRAAIALALAVLGGLAVFEATMQPSAGDRLELLAVFAATAAVTALAAWLLPRWARRFTTLERTFLLASLAAVAVVGAAVAMAAWLMFFSSHDLDLLLVVLGFGLGLGLIFALSTARPLTEDLRRIRRTAAAVGGGDLSARTGVQRPDEVGAVAAALDDMAGRLASAGEERERQEEARRQFLAAVGHDLRTPLAALRAAVEALQDGMAPDPARYLQSMERDLEALGALVDDLFMLARLEAGELRFDPLPLDLAELADEALEALAPVARRSEIDLRLETPGRVPVVGGAEALGRVIRNLVDNAIRHAPPRTEVVVSVANGDAATLAVADDGPGFPPELLDAAFGSFVRADPARARATGGAGLGLAIARGVVEAHGGRIWAEPGPGGCVALRLPSG